VSIKTRKKPESVLTRERFASDRILGAFDIDRAGFAAWINRILLIHLDLKPALYQLMCSTHARYSPAEDDDLLFVHVYINLP
jgi:hypothetical protein